MTSLSRDDIETGDVLRLDGVRFIVTGEHHGRIEVAELGNRILSDCPVTTEGDCIDPVCDGEIGESERDPATSSAHELYCFQCGLNWVERSGYWEEQYAEWPTAFSVAADDDQTPTDTVPEHKDSHQ